jgi:DNA-binding XRE family transcriptional regulator
MLVVVKKPHTKRPLFEISGRMIPAWILDGVKKNYGTNANIEENENELIRVEDSDWYKEMKKTITPGDSLRIYRTRDHLTQVALAAKIGATQQRINEWEKGKREMSKEIAKKLGELFGTSPVKFI